MKRKDSRVFKLEGSSYSVECQPKNIRKELFELSCLAKKFPKNRLNVNLYKLMYNEELYVLAYEKLKSNVGNMTPGLSPETLDGLSMEWIEKVIISMKDLSFQFKPLRRTLIPKKNGRTRPLTIAGPRDKIIQECIRIILECIFEPIFKDNVHSFRTNRGCHSALKYIDTHFQSSKWILNCDIIKFFDEVNVDMLMDVLSKRISCKKFLDLIRKSLNAGYGFMGKKPLYSLTGVPQGSIISPILSNIYLSVFDNYINKLKEDFDIGEKPNVSKCYMRLKSKKDWQQKKGNVAEVLKYKNAMLNEPYYEEGPSYKKLVYVRYVDDFIIGIRGSYSDVKILANKVKAFLKDELDLDITWFISDFTKDVTKFLGVLIKRNSNIFFKRVVRNEKSTLQRINTRIQFYAPMNDIVKKLINTGFMNKKREGVPKFVLLFRDIKEILNIYNAVIRGFHNYYYMVNNMGKLVSLLWHRLRESCAKLLAAKMKLKTQKKVFEKFGANLSYDGMKLFKPSYTRVKRFRFKVKEGDSIQIIKGLTSTQKSLATLLKQPCKNCGSMYKVEMHHIRHMSDIKGKKDKISVLMARARRKQIPLCRKCHNEVHNRN